MQTPQIDTQAIVAIFSLLHTGVVVFDDSCQIVWANDKARHLGISDANLQAQISSGTHNTFDLMGTIDKVIPGTHAVSARSEFEGRKINFTLSKIPGQDGDVWGVLLLDDVSQIANLEKEIAQNERLAVLGKLCAKVAHELNNPMDGILRYLSLAIRIVEHQQLEKPLEYLQQCRRGLLRMVQITSELLEFSRSTPVNIDRVEIQSVLDEAVRLYDSKASAAGVQIIKDYRNMPLRSCDGNFYQVFCNIIKNAIDVMPGGGTLHISTAKTTGNAVVIEFRDSGPGCKRGYESMIFEPFFTTKPDGKGTGLGLAVCKDIIEKYGGAITAENMPEGGCTFTINLPI